MLLTLVVDYQVVMQSSLHEARMDIFMTFVSTRVSFRVRICRYFALKAFQRSPAFLRTNHKTLALGLCVREIEIATGIY